MYVTGRPATGAFSGRPDLWRDHIDRHVFFWVTAERRDRFVTACIRLRPKGSTCNGLAPVVIEIETESLLAAHHAAAFFSMINTGSVIRGGARTRRGETTLRPIAGWRGERVVELAIRDPVRLMSSANIAG